MTSGTTTDLAAPSALRPAAHTSIQLLQQLEADGYDGDGQQLIRNALGLASRLFACRFQYSGEPFLVHVVGAASYLSALKAPPELVAAGLIHNVYGNGDFGDARAGAVQWKRDIVRRALGVEVEQYVYEFWQSLRWPREKVVRMSQAVDSLGKSDRGVLLLRLADVAEHHRDLGQAFRRRRRRPPEVIDAWLALARELAGPSFAAELYRLFEATASTSLPEDICGFTGQKGSFPVLPRSYRRRVSVALRQTSSRVGRFPSRFLGRARKRAGALPQP